MIITRESHRIILDMTTNDALELIRTLADCLRGQTRASIPVSELDTSGLHSPASLYLIVKPEKTR